MLCPDPQKTVRAEDIWCESVAVISDVEKIDELPTYGYSLSYRAPESTALDKYGNKIQKNDKLTIYAGTKCMKSGLKFGEKISQNVDSIRTKHCGKK